MISQICRSVTKHVETLPTVYVCQEWMKKEMTLILQQLLHQSLQLLQHLHRHLEVVLLLVQSEKEDLCARRSRRCLLQVCTLQYVPFCLSLFIFGALQPTVNTAVKPVRLRGRMFHSAKFAFVNICEFGVHCCTSTLYIVDL